MSFDHETVSEEIEKKIDKEIEKHPIMNPKKQENPKQKGGAITKKCDVTGCKEKAVWFSKTESLCTFHYQDKVRQCYEQGRNQDEF